MEEIFLTDKSIHLQQVDKKRFGTNLKEILLKRGIKQSTLAKQIGVCPNRVSDYTRGKNMPSLYNLIKITEILQVSLDYLLEGCVDYLFQGKQYNPLNNYLGKNIKICLMVKGMTAKELSKRMNVTENIISKYINGRRIPDMPVIERIADIFDASVDELLGITCENMINWKSRVLNQTNPDNFGQQLQLYLLKNNVSKFKLAQLLGVSHQTISLYLMNDIYPSDEKLNIISTYFNVPLEELLIFKPKKVKKKVDDFKFPIILKSKMQERGISEQELSRKTEISAFAIKSYIRGRSLPRFENTKKIAKVLGISVDELLGIQLNSNERFDLQVKYYDITEPNCFGKNLKLCLKENGIKSKEFGKLIKNSNVRYYISGKVKPRVDTLYYIAITLNISVDILLGNA